MVMAVVSPRKSITETFLQKVGGSYFKTIASTSTSSGSSGRYYHRIGRCSFDVGEGENDCLDGMELAQMGSERRTKNVLILMSDTGGGHRASAEAIRDAFRIEFGDEYKVKLLAFD